MSRIFLVRQFGALALIGSLSGFLAGCEESALTPSSVRASAPIPPATLALMQTKGTTKEAPVLIRTYKKEAELEIWKMKSDGRYALLKTYPICRWSGQLGPKAHEGDRQVPEGFYSITPAQMKPDSAYYLAFNVGYPNAFDRANGHSGGSIMVHGICSSRGCFSMTDPQIGEIYAIAREGFAAGQREIQMQSYPFRMSAENMAKYRLDPNIGFWKQLKEGSDNFEATQREVAVGVCDRRYVFNAAPADGSRFDPSGPCPALKRDEEIRSLVAARERRDDAKVADLIAQGVRPVRTIYADGGQNPAFASRFLSASRPEALAQPPLEVALDDDKSRKLRLSPAVQLAALRASAPAPATVSRPVNPSEATGTIADAAKASGSLFSRLFGAKEQPHTESAAVANVAVAPAETTKRVEEQKATPAAVKTAETTRAAESAKVGAAKVSPGAKPGDSMKSAAAPAQANGSAPKGGKPQSASGQGSSASVKPKSQALAQANGKKAAAASEDAPAVAQAEASKK